MVPLLRAVTVSANRIVLPVACALLAFGAIAYSGWQSAAIRTRSGFETDSARRNKQQSVRPVPKPDSGVLLVYGDSQGQCRGTYRMRMAGATTLVSENRSKVSSICTEMVLSQRSSESTTNFLLLETKITAGTITVNGAPSPIPVIGQVVRTKMARNGAIVSNEGSNGLDLKSTQLEFPRVPVRKGFTWTVPVPESSNVPVALEVQYCIEDVVRLVGETRVRISSNVQSVGRSSIEGADLVVEAKGEIWFSVDRGVMLSNEVDSRMELVLDVRIGGSAKAQQTRTRMSMRMEMRLEQ